MSLRRTGRAPLDATQLYAVGTCADGKSAEHGAMVNRPALVMPSSSATSATLRVTDIVGHGWTFSDARLHAAQRSASPAADFNRIKPRGVVAARGFSRNGDSRGLRFNNM